MDHPRRRRSLSHPLSPGHRGPRLRHRHSPPRSYFRTVMSNVMDNTGTGLVDGALASETIRSSSLYNEDLAPISSSQRSWGTYNYAALWIAMSVNIPTYMLASGMIAGGMSWRQAIFTVFLGNILVLAPMLLNAHAGAKYGIPFPVFARASFGVLGANVAAILRALVACGWFGINAWIGGAAVNVMVAVLVPSWRTY